MKRQPVRKPYKFKKKSSNPFPMLLLLCIFIGLAWMRFTCKATELPHQMTMAIRSSQADDYRPTVKHSLTTQKQNLHALIRQAARRYKIDPDLLQAQCIAESGCDMN